MQATRVATDVYGTLDASVASWGTDGLLTLASVGGECSADRNQKFKSKLYFLCDAEATTPILSVREESFYGCQ